MNLHNLNNFGDMPFCNWVCATNHLDCQMLWTNKDTGKVVKGLVHPKSISILVIFLMSLAGGGSGQSLHFCLYQKPIVGLGHPVTKGIQISAEYSMTRHLGHQVVSTLIIAKSALTTKGCALCTSTTENLERNKKSCIHEEMICFVCVFLHIQEVEEMQWGA